MTEASPTGEARIRGFVILPDQRSGIEAGIVGAALLFAGVYFGWGLFSIFAIALGAVMAASAILSVRGLSSLPRIEVDNRGIREVSHFGVTQSHQWTAIAWFEPLVREHADGTDYVLRIKGAGSTHSKEAEHSDLNLDCYLPKNINRDHAVTWIADWLDEFRQQTLSRADALQKLRHPKYLKGKFV
jgi:hypothetical protein